MKTGHIPLILACALLCPCCATGEDDENDAGPDIPDMTALDPDAAPDVPPDLPVDPGSDTPADPAADTTPDADPYGFLCKPCGGSDECGGPEDQCLRSSDTGEIFCAKHCATPADCPDGFLCEEIPSEPPTDQCVPASGSCSDLP